MKIKSADALEGIRRKAAKALSVQRKSLDFQTLDLMLMSQMVQWQRICLLMQEMQEMQVQSLDLEDPLEEEMATTPVFLLGKSHG